MEIIIVALFCTVLIACIGLDLPILLPLTIGLLLFLGYGLYKGHGLVELLKMCWSSILTVHTILLTFFLIGMLTASWRASGTIPVIVSLSASCIVPSCFILATFLLNALISFLIGTSFGTVATMGVICVSVAKAMMMNQFWTVGAIISGIYFGDRCSPVSTSALLIATLTKTDLYDNIKLMLKSCAVPLCLTCGIYYLVGVKGYVPSGVIDIRSVFASSFNLSLICVMPAIAIIVLALLRVQVKLTMGFSILIAAIIAVVLQNVSPAEMTKILLWGYEATDKDLAKMLNGGGIFSMLRPAAIVCIACCYSGIFKGTGLLDGIQEHIFYVEKKFGSFATVLLMAVVDGMIACNQSLNIMLTQQLCEKLDMNDRDMAIALEDTSVLVSPLIPWNIAGAVPLATIGASSICLLAACFLYLVPLYRLLFQPKIS